jgi:hypothetical protein
MGSGARGRRPKVSDDRVLRRVPQAQEPARPVSRSPNNDQRYYDIFAELVKECGFAPLPSSRTFTLSDMMYQVPGLHDAFVSTKRKSRAFFPVQLELKQDRNAKLVWLLGTLDVGSYGVEDRRRLRAFIEETAGVERVAGKTDRVRFETTPTTYTQSPLTVLRTDIVDRLRKHLWSEQTPAGFRYYLGCRKEFTAQVAANFAIMFTLGMIVRYAPEFIDRLEGEWLIHEYLATQPLQFAYLLGSGLVRNELVPNPLSSALAI